MFRIAVDESFSAGHALRGYQGKCENVHGHNYKVRLTLEGPELDSLGLLCDFVHLKELLRGIIRSLDHQFLNDLEAFRLANPSAENLAKYFYEQSAGKLEALPVRARVADVTVWETDGTSASYSPG
jgi:6-pyruvoyltetrahydropterin/6-carboxytetrahydropterin synthase